MLGKPIQSNRRADGKRVVGIGLMSLAVHCALIGAAAYATLGATEAAPVVLDTTIVYVPPLPRQAQPQPVRLPGWLEDPSLAIAPPTLPDGIPPVRLLEMVDHPDSSGSAVQRDEGTGPVAPDEWWCGGPIGEGTPEQLSFPPPEYPPLLKQANIEGTVMVEFVIDTMGRVEPHSIKVVRSPNPEFDRPVRSSLTRALFRPARMHGRAVRVQVSMPVLFRLR